MKYYSNFLIFLLVVSSLANASTGDIGTLVLMGISFLIAIVVVLLVSVLSAIYYFKPKEWLLKIARGVSIIGSILSFICFCSSFISAFDHSTVVFPVITGLIFLVCIGSNYLINFLKRRVSAA